MPDPIITSTLYRIDNYTTGSPTWTDVTPTAGAPIAPYGLAIDAVTSLVLGALVRLAAETEQTFVRSADRGAAWSGAVAELPHLGLRKAGALVLFFGDQALDLSLDNGVTVTDLVGDWATSVGPLGTFTNAIAII